MITALLMLCLSAGPAFEVHTIPLPHPGVRCFLAQTGADGQADLFLLDGHSLHVYENAQLPRNGLIELPPGTTAVDVRDVDGDGAGDVLAVCGVRMLLYHLENLGDGTLKPRVLFELETQLSGMADAPFLHVMAVEREGRHLLALPTEDSFDVRALDGAVIEQHPIGSGAPQHAAFGYPFTAIPARPPTVGPPGSFEMRVMRLSAFKPQLPEGMLPVKTVAPFRRLGGARQGAGQTSADWPWFPLYVNGEATRDRVLYAGARSGNTLVRVQRQPLGAESPEAPSRLGPERRYPGRVLLPKDVLPDFNADGFVDLLLWSSPEPSPTVSALTRAAVEGTWPVRLSTHLFLDKSSRFSPRPDGSVEVRVPLAWFWTMDGGGPVRHLVLQDLDGDGATDLACCTAPEVFSIWCFGEAGLPARPDFKHRFAEPIQEVVLQARLREPGPITAVLRGQQNLYVVEFTGPSPPRRQSVAASSEGS